MKEKTNYSIVRAQGAGVFFGIITKKEGSEVTMNECRKIHYWDGAAAIEQLSVDGTSAPQKCRFTISVDDAVIMNVIQILACTEKAVESIKSVPEWKL